MQLARISLADGCSSSNFKTLLSYGGLFVSITHTLTLHVCFVIMTKHRENPIVSSQSIYLLLIMGYCLNSIRVLQPAIAPRGPFGCVRALVTNGAAEEQLWGNTKSQVCSSACRNRYQLVLAGHKRIPKWVLPNNVLGLHTTDPEGLRTKLRPDIMMVASQTTASFHPA